MAYVVFLSLLKQLCFPKDHSESSSRTGLEIKEGHILPIFGSVLGAQQNGILIKATTDFNKKKKKKCSFQQNNTKQTPVHTNILFGLGAL